jgi:hypothetical protein
VGVQIGRRTFTARAEPLPLEAAVQEFKDYARRHPRALKALVRVLRYAWDGTEASYLALAQRLPVVCLRPLNK